MKTFLAALSLLAAASSAWAVPGPVLFFSDNFDANALSRNSPPSGWLVNSGTVDVIGTGDPWDVMPGNGKYVDLDGSTREAGVLFRDFSLLANTQYTLSFELAGNHRFSSSDMVTVAFGSAQTILNVASNQAFTLSTLAFSPTVNGSFRLSFYNAGGDNVGALLDRVTIVATPVPEPNAYAMLLAGLGIFGLIVRRRKLSTGR